jgi:hypothetical protein
MSLFFLYDSDMMFFRLSLLCLCTTLALSSCSGKSSGGSQSLESIRIGNISAKDVPSIFFDIAGDTLESSSQVSTLSSEGSEEIPGNFSGAATLNKTKSGSVHEGLIKLLSFRNRQGIPSVAQGQLNFDLNIQTTTITGDIEGTGIEIAGEKLSFKATYDL